MLLPLLALVAALLCSLLFRFYQNLRNRINESGLPKPRTALLNGSWFNMWNKVIGEEDLKNLKECGKLHWTLDGRTPHLIVADPDLVKLIISENIENLESFRACRVRNEVLKKSLQSIERKGKDDDKSNSVFDEVNIKKLIPRIERSAEGFVQELQKKTGNIHMQQCLMQYIGDVIAMTIFGIDLYSEEFKDKQAEFMENINRIYAASDPTTIAVLPYTFRNLFSMDDNIFPSKALLFFSNLCVSVLDNKQAVPNVEIESRGPDVIDLLMEKIIKEKVPEESIGQVEETLPNAAEITSQCLSIILYLVRSTQVTLSAAMHVLSNSEEEQTKLCGEIAKINYPSGEKSYGFPCLEAQYLEMFLKEIQRLYPIEYRLSREVKKDVKLGQVTIYPGESVTVPVYAIHRLAEFYPDALEFKPERFSEENMKEVRDMTYFPSGQAASNPSFVGYKLYRLFTKIAFAYAFMNFKISPPDEQFRTPLSYLKGATEVPVLMPVVVQLEKRS